jgi:hypothetical protein
MIRWDRTAVLVTLLVVMTLAVGVFGPGSVLAGGLDAGTDQPANEPHAGDPADQVAQTEDEVDPTAYQTAEQEFTRTVFRIKVYNNSDARWTTELSRPLNDSQGSNDVENFEEFAARFENESTEAFDNFQIYAAEVTSTGTDVTGRQMEPIAFEREAEINRIGQTRGRIAMSFRWTNFTVDRETSLVMGDVFTGGWAIDKNQWLQVQAGKNLTLTGTPEPAPNSGSVEEDSVTWFGELAFAPEGRPRVEFNRTNVEGGAGENGTNGGDGTGEDGETDDSSVDDSGTGLLGVFVLLLFVIVAGLALAWYAGVVPRSEKQPEQATGEDAGAPPPPETESASESPVVSPEETLSDEDRVLTLLEDNGGRMKQVSIVDETDWSKSKVSMLLSDMEDDEQISKLRVGRENIISISGEEPEAAGSPFEDE